MFNIAILGMGVVGGGVYEVLKNNASAISHKLGGNGEPLINVAHVLDLRSFEGHDLEKVVTKDFDKIVNDPSVSVVVETMGGAQPAFDFSLKALESGKSVVTSNKEVVAKYGDVLLEAAKRNNVCYLYEASVGGGIPVIAPLINCLTANKVTRIAGILNGTTNYILTKMLYEGAAFEDVLKDAQAKGYAEKDPTADVEGFDALRKICILAGIAFGKHIPTESAALRRGITGIDSADIAAAAKAGYAVKLLGVAEQVGDKASIMVAPHLVKQGTQIASTIDVFNAVSVTGNMVDELVFYGCGAGSLPTASAVVSDIIQAIRCPVAETPRKCCEEGFVLSLDETPVKLYVRTASPADESLGTVIALEIGEKAIITEKAPYGELKKKLASVEIIAEHFVL